MSAWIGGAAMGQRKVRREVGHWYWAAAGKPGSGPPGRRHRVWELEPAWTVAEVLHLRGPVAMARRQPEPWIQRSGEKGGIPGPEAVTQPRIGGR